MLPLELCYKLLYRDCSFIAQVNFDVYEISVLICIEPICWFQIAANGTNAKKLRIGLALSWVFFLHVSFIKKSFQKKFY
jgi:hypothetical protein